MPYHLEDSQREIYSILGAEGHYPAPFSLFYSVCHFLFLDLPIVLSLFHEFRVITALWTFAFFAEILCLA